MRSHDGGGNGCGGLAHCPNDGHEAYEAAAGARFRRGTAAALTIMLASYFGIPLSTTHTINTAIMGVGATRRISAVRWGVGREMVVAWILTFPVSMMLGWISTKIFLHFWK
jgi:PiT family inorganic phosphate transporter